MLVSLSAVLFFLSFKVSATKYESPLLLGPIVAESVSPSSSDDLIKGLAGIIQTENGDENVCGIDVSGNGTRLDTMGGNDKLIGKTESSGEQQEGVCVRASGVLDLGDGNDILKGTSTSDGEGGCDISSGGVLDFGPGNDVMICKGGNLALFVHSGADVFLGSGDDSLTVKGEAIVQSGAFIDFGDGDDSMIVKGDTTVRSGGDIFFGDGKNLLTIKGNTTVRSGGDIFFGNGNNLLTIKGNTTMRSGGDIFFGDGTNSMTIKGDVTMGTGGKIVFGNGINSLSIKGDANLDRDPVIIFGSGDDSLTIKGDANMTTNTTIDLGGGDDIVKVAGCLSLDLEDEEVTFNMGSGKDKIFASARFGTLNGGPGADDCYEPSIAGEYQIQCNVVPGFSAALIVKKTNNLCMGIVTLENIERFGCGHTYLELPPCPLLDGGGYQGTITFGGEEKTSYGGRSEKSSTFTLNEGSDEVLFLAKKFGPRRGSGKPTIIKKKKFRGSN